MLPGPSFRDGPSQSSRWAGPDGTEDKVGLLRRLQDRAGEDTKYRNLLTVGEQVTEFMRDNTNDLDVVAYRDAEPSPPADLGSE
jgi:hypothetical protein